MEFELDIKTLLVLLQKRIKWIILSLVAGTLIMYLTAQFIITPKYTSYISMYVNNLALDEIKSVNLNDINASQKLVNTYIVLLTNDEILDQVSERISVPYTAAQLRSALTMTAVNNTEVLKIQAETESPELSVEICKAIAEIAPGVLQRVVKGGSVEVIGSPKLPRSPSSPNVRNLTLIGALLGLAVSVFLTVLLHIFDNTVKGEEDLKQYIEAPILGEVPKFEIITKGKGPYAK